MRVLDAKSAIEAGGWDARFAVALAVQMHDDIAAALIDTNGDQSAIDLDRYERGSDGLWHEGGSGSAGDEGAHWSGRMVTIWGRAAPGQQLEVDYLGDRRPIVANDAGWWLFIAPTADLAAMPVVRSIR